MTDDTTKHRVDVDRCIRAMEDISVDGLPDGNIRAKAIEDAIKYIQLRPDTAMTTHYVGVKIYSGFGDQREDHRYGMGPRHGSIVFRIERTRENCERMKRGVGGIVESAPALNADHVYMLECMRDFGHVEVKIDGKDKKLNLVQAIRRLEKQTGEANFLSDALGNAVVESHEQAGDDVPNPDEQPSDNQVLSASMEGQDASELKQRISDAVGVVARYGQIDGGHHKAWVIDQAIRRLLGHDYAAWVAGYCVGDAGETYDWSEGVAP